jgi:hypothetical protein
MPVEERDAHHNAFHADPALKREMLARLKTHALRGEVINAANVWKDGKGGPVSCMVHDTDFAVWQERTGIPKAVGAALDVVASYMDGPDQAADFAAEWVEAVEVGQDLRGVAPALLAWLLSDSEHGILRSVERDAARLTIGAVADLHRRTAVGDVPPEAEWRAARVAAMAATDAVESSFQKAIAAAGEAAAWNPETSAAVVSDAVRAWDSLLSLRVPDLMGRGAIVDREIKEWLARLRAAAEKDGLPAPNMSEHDLCVTHPAAVALRRAYTEQVRQAQREDRRRLAEALLTMTVRSASPAINA